MTTICIAAWRDYLPEPVAKFLDGPLGIVALLVVGALGIFLLAWVASKVWRAVVGVDSGPRGKETRENLADYPPPGKPGPVQLYIDGVPVRVRLVAVAPGGSSLEITQDTVPSILEEIVPGLGHVAEADKPRVVIWEPQLSLQGFAPIFHRRVVTPEEEGQPSPWILVAGPAELGKKRVLLGLALLAEKQNLMGRRAVSLGRWVEMLQTKNRA